MSVNILKKNKNYLKPVLLGVKRLLKITFPFHLLSLHQLVRWATNAPWSIFFRFSALRMKYMSSRGGEKGLSFRDVLFSGYAKVNAQHGICIFYVQGVFDPCSSYNNKTWKSRYFSGKNFWNTFAELLCLICIFISCIHL